MVRANKILYEITQERDRQVNAHERLRLLSFEILPENH